jgi:hypothetical protein
MCSEVLRISRGRNISEDLRLINACHGSGDRLSAFNRGRSGSMAGSSVGMLGGQVALGEVSVRVLVIFPFRIIPLLLRLHSFINHWRYLILVSFNSRVEAV